MNRIEKMLELICERMGINVPEETSEGVPWSTNSPKLREETLNVYRGHSGFDSELIAAVKFVRSKTNWGLKEAKEYVESII